MADVDPALMRAKRAIEQDLLNRPGVAGVDIGFKEVGGQRTDRLAIRVLVKKKRDVRPEEQVPESVEGFPTDVIERTYEPQVLAVAAQDLLVQVDSRQYDSLKGGISIGPCRPIDGAFLGGTLGLSVKDKATGKGMFLSNFHVLCGDPSWAVGDTITQPARIDGGSCPNSIVGSLQRGVLNDQVDCAVAEVTARIATSEIVEIGEVTGTDVASLDEPVRKRGRTTGLTFGFVDGVDLTVIVPYLGIGEITLTNQIGVRPDTKQNPKFSAAGDSGSVVVNAAGEAVGLHFAGNSSDGHAAANPIAAVLAALNVTIQPASPPTPPAPPMRPSYVKARSPMLEPYPPRYPRPAQPPVLLRFPPGGPGLRPFMGGLS
jgi:hypothetical protein